MAASDDGTGFLLVRLWLEAGAHPTLRARLLAVLDVSTGEVRTVVTAGHEDTMRQFDALLRHFGGDRTS